MLWSKERLGNQRVDDMVSLGVCTVLSLLKTKVHIFTLPFRPPPSPSFPLPSSPPLPSPSLSLHHRVEEIERMWQELQQKLEVCCSSLSSYHDFMAVFAEMDDCLQEMSQIEVGVSSSLHAQIHCARGI